MNKELLKNELMENGMMGNEAPVVNIHVFGSVRISANGQTFQESDYFAPVSWNTLVYLLVNRGRKVTTQRLANALQMNNENGNATKNVRSSIGRIVSRCKEITGVELIVSDRNGLHVDHSLSICTDYELFEYYMEAANCCRSREEKIHYLERAIDLYEGPFFESHGYDIWMAHYVGRSRQPLYLKKQRKCCLVSCCSFIRSA